MHCTVAGEKGVPTQTFLDNKRVILGRFFQFFHTQGRLEFRTLKGTSSVSLYRCIHIVLKHMDFGRIHFLKIIRQTESIIGSNDMKLSRCYFGGKQFQ